MSIPIFVRRSLANQALRQGLKELPQNAGLNLQFLIDGAFEEAVMANSLPLDVVPFHAQSSPITMHARSAACNRSVNQLTKNTAMVSATSASRSGPKPDTNLTQ
ncbi:MAG: hypothetical protein KF708_07695, partial [Pirellulales bacterium]|nr:hypothetical protein [Pirellulales bacterium]